MSHFAFLDAEWPDLAGEARKAESLSYPDPRTACFYARRVLELTVTWLYKHDSALKLPYRDHRATQMIGSAAWSSSETSNSMFAVSQQVRIRWP